MTWSFLKIAAVTVLAFSLFSCAREGIDDPSFHAGPETQPVKERICLNMSIEASVTKASPAVGFRNLGADESDSDGISMEVSRLAEPMESCFLPETKGEALRTELPSRLWFNIYDVDDDTLWSDSVSNTNGKWLTENAYYLNPDHTYRFFVSSFDNDLSSVPRNVPNNDTFIDSVDESSYVAFSKDDLVGFYEHEGGTESSVYDVTMRHIYSAVFFSFSGDGPTGARITSVSLKNLRRNGRLDCNADGVTWSSYKSTYNNAVNSVDYSITNGTSYSFPSLGPTYVCSNSVNSYTVLEVKMVYLGTTFTLTKNLSDESWLPGYKYTYQFRFSGFTDPSNYYLDISPSSGSVDIGESIDFVASLKFEREGSVYTVSSGVTNVSWTSSNTSVASGSSYTYSSGKTKCKFDTKAIGSTYIACRCRYGGNVYETANYPNSALLAVNDYVVDESLTIDSFTYSPNPHDASSGTMSPSVSYTHRKEYYSGTVIETHDDATLAYMITSSSGFSVNANTGEVTVSACSGEARTATVTVTASVLGCDCSASKTCTVSQEADAVSYYEKPVLTGTLTYSPNPVSAAGGTSSPVTSSLSYTQKVHWTSGKVTTLTNQGGSWKYSMSASTGFSLNSITTGNVTVAENGTSSVRSATVSVKVVANGLESEASKSCTVSQEAATYSSELVASRDKDVAWVGEEVQLTATLNTLRNGVVISSEDVTSAATWTRAGGSMALSVDTDGKVTAGVYGLAEFIATYDYVESDPVTVVFNQRTLQLTPDGGSNMIPQGNRISFKNTGAVKQVRYEYDFLDEEFKTVVGSNVGYNSCTWTVADENILHKVSAGVFEGKKVGTTSVSVTFGSYKGNVNVTVLRKVDNN